MIGTTDEKIKLNVLVTKEEQALTTFEVCLNFLISMVIYVILKPNIDIYFYVFLYIATSIWLAPMLASAILRFVVSKYIKKNTGNMLSNKTGEVTFSLYTIIKTIEWSTEE